MNTTKTTPAALMARLLAEGRESREVPGVENALELLTPGGLAGLPSFREGLFHVQDLSSQLCAAALAPLRGPRAPGPAPTLRAPGAFSWGRRRTSKKRA